MGQTVKAVAVGAMLARLAGPLRAALPDEIQVYTDDINGPGESGLEIHVNTTPRSRGMPEFPGEVPPAQGIRVAPEFSRGLTDSLEAGLYLPMAHDADGRSHFGGPKVRLKWLPVRPQARGGWFAGTNWEYSWLNRGFEPETRRLELRPIIGWRERAWLLAANPVLSWASNERGRGCRPELNPSFKVAREIGDRIALGVEYYAELGPWAGRLRDRSSPARCTSRWSGIARRCLSMSASGAALAAAPITGPSRRSSSFASAAAEAGGCALPC